MRCDLLQPLQVFTQLSVQPVRHDLRRCAFMHVLPAVEEPTGNVVAFWVLDDADDLLDLVLGEFASALVQVDASALEDKTCEAQPAALDSPKRERTLASSVDVGVENTQNELEVFGLCDDQRALRGSYHPPQEINMAIRPDLRTLSCHAGGCALRRLRSRPSLFLRKTCAL